jgi:hypothetical protein
MAIGMARELGVDQINVATPFDVSWDDPGIRRAAIEPLSVQFCNDSEQRIAANWNPFPDELEATAIEAAFHSRWLEQFAFQPGAPLEPKTESGHMCHWLYKNMVMDATGRIIPCCAAPRPDADLVFDTFDGASPDSFNTEKYRLAR